MLDPQIMALAVPDGHMPLGKCPALDKTFDHVVSGMAGEPRVVIR